MMHSSPANPHMLSLKESPIPSRSSPTKSAAIEASIYRMRSPALTYLQQVQLERVREGVKLEVALEHETKIAKILTKHDELMEEKHHELELLEDQYLANRQKWKHKISDEEIYNTTLHAKSNVATAAAELSSAEVERLKKEVESRKTALHELYATKTTSEAENKALLAKQKLADEVSRNAVAKRDVLMKERDRLLSETQAATRSRTSLIDGHGKQMSALSFRLTDANNMIVKLETTLDLLRKEKEVEAASLYSELQGQRRITADIEARRKAESEIAKQTELEMKGRMNAMEDELKHLRESLTAEAKARGMAESTVTSLQSAIKDVEGKLVEEKKFVYSYQEQLKNCKAENDAMVVVRERLKEENRALGSINKDLQLQLDEAHEESSGLRDLMERKKLTFKRILVAFTDRIAEYRTILKWKSFTSRNIKSKLLQQLAVSRLRLKARVKEYGNAGVVLSFMKWKTQMALDCEISLRRDMESGTGTLSNKIVSWQRKFENSVDRLIQENDVRAMTILKQKCFFSWKHVITVGRVDKLNASLTAATASLKDIPAMTKTEEVPREEKVLASTETMLEALADSIRPVSLPETTIETPYAAAMAVEPIDMEDHTIVATVEDKEAVITNRVVVTGESKDTSDVSHLAQSSMGALVVELRGRVSEELYLAGEQFFSIVEPEEAAFGARLSNQATPKAKFRACLHWIKTGSQLSWLIGTHDRVSRSLLKMEAEVSGDGSMNFDEYLDQHSRRPEAAAAVYIVQRDMEQIRDACDAVWQQQRSKGVSKMLVGPDASMESAMSGGGPLSVVLPLDESVRFSASSYPAKAGVGAASGREEAGFIHPRKFWLLVQHPPPDSSIKELEQVLWKMLHLIATHDRGSGLRLRRHEGQRKLLDLQFYCIILRYIRMNIHMESNYNEEVAVPLLKAKKVKSRLDGTKPSSKQVSLLREQRLMAKLGLAPTPTTATKKDTIRKYAMLLTDESRRS